MLFNKLALNKEMPMKIIKQKNFNMAQSNPHQTIFNRHLNDLEQRPIMVHLSWVTFMD